MLAIDIGNSRIKWALFEGDDIQDHGAFEYNYNDLEKTLDGERLPSTTEIVQISCVARNELKNRIIKWLGLNDYNEFSFAETQSKQCNVINSYEIVSNLGVDRWLAMIAAYNLSDSKSNITCVVDCGTAVTLDMIDAKGVHLGGLIMPGYSTMVKSLVRDTGNLVGLNEMVTVLGGNEKVGVGIATSTNEAVFKGCMQLLIEGVSGIIEKYQMESEEKMSCVVTGGDGKRVSDALICANTYNPFLVLQGLRIVSTKNETNE